MESTGEHYRCDKCGWTWDHEDDACPNCGSDLYIQSFYVPTRPNIQTIQNQIKSWSDGQFGKHRTAKPIAYHLKEEIDELIDALEIFYQGAYSNISTEDGMKRFEQSLKRVKFELADCMMLLIDCAAHVPLNMDEVLKATEEKLQINKTRQWGAPDKNGVVRHIKQ